MPAESKPATVDVVVTVDDQHMADLDALTKRLQGAGLSVQQTLGAAGIITGAAGHADLDRLRQVTGVKAVETSGDVQIAPPDAGVQ